MSRGTAARQSARPATATAVKRLRVTSCTLIFGNVSVAPQSRDVARLPRPKNAAVPETAPLPQFAGNRASTRPFGAPPALRSMHLPHTLGKVTEQL